jgi:hypothetical protein
MVDRVAGLKSRLEDSEEPVLGLFLRFFPLQYFMDHMAAVKRQW